MPPVFLAPTESADCVGLGPPFTSVVLAFAGKSLSPPVTNDPFAAALAVGSIVWVTLSSSCADDEDAFALMTAVSLTAAAAVGVAGYICASSTIMSAGRSLYHFGATSPVGRVMSIPVSVELGIAVLRTERTESLVGSMVAGSMARTSRSATAWALGCTVLARATERSAPL